MDSDKIIENLTNRIMKLELLVSYLIKDEKQIMHGIINEQTLCGHLYCNSDYPRSPWIDKKQKIDLEISPGELLKLNSIHPSQLLTLTNIVFSNEDRFLQEDKKLQYIEFQYIEPKKYIENFYEKINDVHIKNKERFNSIEKERIEKLKMENKSQYENIKKNMEKQRLLIEEKEYEKQLLEAKIQARIKAQEKILEEEALKELRAINYNKESTVPDLI
jgi:hypothetical protein